MCAGHEIAMMLLSVALTCAASEASGRTTGAAREGLPMDEEAALLEADRAFAAATRARGVEGWLAYFAPEALVFPPVGPIAVGSAERELFFRGRPFPPPGFTWEPDEAWCAGSGDLGFTRGTWSAAPAQDGAAAPGGRYLSVWTKRAQGWRVLADLSDDPRFLRELARPLGSHAHEVQHAFHSRDEALHVEAGVVRCADGRTAKFLRLWRRGEGGALELVHETGAFDLDAPRLEPWPEADRLFRADPRWRGGDGASSVDLGGERILWLFADSFVALHGGPRRDARMVRNSIAIQRGRDPRSAAMEFAWGEREGEPRSFFHPHDRDERELWLWPASGQRVGARLVLFFFAVRPSEGGLGFALDRSRAAFVDEPDAEPRTWRLRWIELPGLPDDLLLGGGGCHVEGEHLYAASPRGENHVLHLVRWPLARVRAGELLDAEAWCGAEGWKPIAEARPHMAPLFAPAQSELTLHRSGERWCALHGFGFGPAPLGIRTAPELTGPWSALQLLHRPAEAARAQILIYAAKTHPALACEGGIAATYIANSLDFGALVADEGLYFPRFLRLRLAPR
jgi:ketosteroid isomerase-like protein